MIIVCLAVGFGHHEDSIFLPGKTILPQRVYRQELRRSRGNDAKGIVKRDSQRILRNMVISWVTPQMFSLCCLHVHIFMFFSAVLISFNANNNVSVFNKLSSCSFQTVSLSSICLFLAYHHGIRINKHFSALLQQVLRLSKVTQTQKRNGYFSCD